MMKSKSLLIFGIAAVAGLGLLACATSRAGYESAPYVTAEKDGDFEVRDYPALTVARTSGRGEDADGAFGRLFRYIQGENAAGAKIEMTTPVFMEHRDSATEMSFVIPAQVAAEGAPMPRAATVTVANRAGGRYAVLRYRGARSQANENAALGRLRDWLKAKGLAEAGAPTYAYFDPPWTPPGMRRNEVMVPLAGR